MEDIPNLILSKERLVLDISAEASTLLGQTPELLLGSHVEQWFEQKPFNDLWCSGRADEPQKLVHLVIASQHPAQPIAACIVLRQDRKIGVHLRALVLEDGNPLSHPITSAATLARTSRAKLPEQRELFAQAPDPILIFDWPSSKVIDANATALKLFGWPIDALYQKLGRDLCAEEPHIFDRITAALHRDGCISGHWSVQDKQAIDHVCRLHAVRYCDFEGAQRYAAVYRPVVEPSAVRNFEDAERLLLGSDRFATLGRLALGVVHEVNNPASWIIGNLQLLRNMLDGLPQKPEAEEMIDECLEGMKRITVLTRALSRYGRPRTGSVSILNVADVIQDATRLVEPLVTQRACIELDAPASLQIEGERGELVHMLVNLLQNAAQAIPEGNPGGNVVRIRAWTASDEVFIDVSDTGRGIPESIQPQIFLPLFTTRSHGEGFGLGLTSCLDIVQRHSGKLGFETDAHGTLFRVSLPALRI